MIKIPIDLTGEQKTVMAIFSIRQFLLIVPAGTISIFQLMMFNWPFIDGWLEFVFRTGFVLVVNGITVSLAFIRMEKADCYLSEYLFVLFRFKQSQKMYTN